MIFKNFRQIESDRYVDFADSSGKSWYEIQDDLSEDSIKVVFDSRGNVIQASEDASVLYPLEFSVAVIEVSDENKKLLNEGARVVEVDGGMALSVSPSKNHEFIDGEWILTEEKKQEIADREREAEADAIQAERAKLMQEMQYHMLLGEEDKAREIALKIKDLEKLK